MCSVTVDLKMQEAALVRAAQAGDRAAFGALYEQYARVVHGILIAHVPYDAAEDLVQEVFIKALERIVTLRDTNAFNAWLLAIARRTAADHNRAHRHDATSEYEAAGGARPDGEAFEVIAMMKRLPEAYRETLLLVWSKV
jgi:RNA polymerase sigma-70 factor, ECF subfamily